MKGGGDLSPRLRIDTAAIPYDGLLELTTPSMNTSCLNGGGRHLLRQKHPHSSQRGCIWAHYPERSLPGPSGRRMQHGRILSSVMGNWCQPVSCERLHREQTKGWKHRSKWHWKTRQTQWNVKINVLGWFRQKCNFWTCEYIITKMCVRGHCNGKSQILFAESWTNIKQPGFLFSSVNFVDEDDDEKYSSTNFFLWLRRDVDELKLISDDKNNDEIYAASSLTRRDGTKMLFEDYRTFRVHPIGKNVHLCHWIRGVWISSVSMADAVDG